MRDGQFPLTVSAGSFLPASLTPFIRPLEPGLQKVLVPDSLVRAIERARDAGPGSAFADKLLDELGIRYEISPGDLRQIPSSGPVMVVANHPFGLLEGLILLPLLSKIRSDFRIVTNSLLSSFPEIRDHCIFVNPFGSREATQQNSRGMRASVEWLSAGGLLVVFPAGEVAHLRWREGQVTDPEWNAGAARLARRFGCPAVPLFFDGTNSFSFQMAGAIHPSLRTLNLLRQLEKKRNRVIRARVGTPVTGAVLRAYPNAEAATGYLRARVYLLSNRSTADAAHTRPIRAARPVIGPTDFQLAAQEVSGLPRNRLLASSEDFQVFLASAAEIPSVLREIGRCREITFRRAGEGTRNNVDLDSFDLYYQQLFLWDRKNGKVAGGYRIASTEDVLPDRGAKGLYTSTLFDYSAGFFEKVGPAFELGRSFICPEYQKHYSALLMLWKAITKCVERRPDCPVLFGAVSISSDYHPFSRALITNFLNGRMRSDLASYVKPRRGYRQPFALPKHVRSLTSLLPGLDELSASISDLELDGKGVPVLLRHYLKIGAQMLGCNVDPKFSNAVDGLLLADLRTAAPAMLDRCMGKSGAARFRDYHGLSSSPAHFAHASADD